MNLKSILVLLILFLPLFGYGQEKKAKASSSAKKERSSINSLLDNAEKASEAEPEKALDYLDEALKTSIQQGDKIGEANTYITLGNINAQQGLYTQAITFYNKALPLYQIEKQYKQITSTRKIIGEAYEKNRQYSLALEQYKIALKEAEASKDEQEIVALKNNIANIYTLQGKTDDALTIYKEVLTKEQKQNNRGGEIDANNNIGDVYIQQNKIEQAKGYYENSQAIAIEDQDEEKLTTSYDKIINTYKLEGNASDELTLRLKKAELNRKSNDHEALSQEYLEIGKVYLLQGKLQEALAYFTKSLTLSKKFGLLGYQAEAHERMSYVYKKQNNYSKALEHFETYVLLKDSLSHANVSKRNTISTYSDELTTKQKQIDLLEKDQQLNAKTILLLQEEKNFSRFVIYALIIGLLIVASSTWLIYTNAKKRRIANQSLILRSLRSQMNPHFIFNALNSVNNFISKNDERSANKYLSDFSKLMRTVMENSRFEFISLSTELSILNLYLSLEHARFKEKFDYTLTVSEDIAQDQVAIPPMLIQPYIENEIWHGLRYREDKGFLSVDIRQQGSELLVTITDDGIGRKKSLELKTHNQKDKDSIGLKNTEARIKIINELYKTNMRVHLEDLNPADASGTKVTLYITQTQNVQHEA